jgi:hypothetical protein
LLLLRAFARCFLFWWAAQHSARPSSGLYKQTPLLFLHTKKVFLIFGKSGWIGGLVGDVLKKQGAKFDYASARLEDRASIVAEIERVRAWRGGGEGCYCV